ncbi:hypothetical protein N7478_007405 [Penicillium angulare]|uniref:uncharacterized protein n=1 Tax=Penicillium angulare TaxID=116970 RepID=UPI0025425248|nr:uncharacterized protein N7478_007405 [Penicillium angulare]KAJ5272280.1 hypothetical protein N7478_007405 [Penicillium angulare]
MDAELRAPLSPVCLIDGHLTEKEDVLWVRNPDRHLQNTTVASSDGEKLFYVKGPGDYQSMTFRRPVKDPEGNAVFDLRRYAVDLKMRWFVQDSNEKKIAELCHERFFTSKHTAINARICHSGEVVEMRPRDAQGSTCYVSIGNATIAEITVHTNNTPKLIVRDRDMSVLRVRVARGVDLSLVVLMALVRAEMMHIWRK